MRHEQGNTKYTTMGRTPSATNQTTEAWPKYIFAVHYLTGICEHLTDGNSKLLCSMI